MKSVRLLPVVILAATALLLFKGLGLVTNGGYVLTGTVRSEAAGAVQGESAADDGVALPTEPTIADTSPTLHDVAPTLPLRSKDSGHAGEAENSHAVGDSGAVGIGSVAPCPPADRSPSAPPDCAQADANAGGDGLSTMQDGNGDIVPTGGGTAGSQEAVIERLGARREELDARAAELDMRLALIEAAEKRLAERASALELLEARVNALVDAKKASDDKQFNTLVAMYEAMNPKEAAAIFDQLDMPVLMRVATALSARRMSQIMAKMDPRKAKELTAGMAAEQTEPGIDLAEDLAALPQIVGQ